jgi:hypothetical protein
MADPLLPIIEARIDRATHRLIEDQVMPWLFLETGPKFSLRRFDGSEIAFQHVAYAGAPRAAFWDGYIVPYLEAMATTEIDHAVSLTAERKADLEKADLDRLLPDVATLLLSAARKVLERMARVDQGMRTDDGADAPPLRPVGGELAHMRDFVSARVSSALAQRMRPS